MERVGQACGNRDADVLVFDARRGYFSNLNLDYGYFRKFVKFHGYLCNLPKKKKKISILSAEQTFARHYINIRGLQYQIYYVGRIDHCTKCRSFATVPHLGRDCDKHACWSCGKVGHSKMECPDRDTDMREPGDDGDENAENPNKRKRPS
jgi:hypothetical protein